MTPVDQQLIDDARCYTCLGVPLADALKLVLLGRISESSASGVPSGVILMWSGTIATIPTGWVLCDGTSGTPDLRNRFVVAANADSAGQAMTTLTGAATQSGGSISHSHGITDPGHIHGITDPGHNHSIQLDNSGDPGSTFDIPSTITDNGATGITVNSGVTGLTVNSQSAPQPYFALAYIMKT